MTPQQSAAQLRLDNPNLGQLHLITKITGKEGATLKNGYWLIGLLGELKVGEPIRVTRLANFYNPEGKWGEFTSTPVIRIVESDSPIKIARTENSVYQIEEI
jgi:hypothetical protein